MFRSKKFSVDSLHEKKEETHLEPHVLDDEHDHEDDSIPVHTMPKKRRSGLRQVPEEYQTLDRARRSGWGFIIFLLLLFGGTVAGFYYWNNRPQPIDGDSLIMKLSGPNEIISGENVTYTVEYTNEDVVLLRNVELDVQWPDGFYFNSSSEDPVSENATTWILGTLEPGETKKLEISGQLVGLRNEIQQAVFRISYRPANINSDFEETDIVDTMITDARLDLELSGPDKVIAGDDVTFTAVVTNVTGEPIENIDIEVILPRDFELIDSDPELIDGVRWQGTLSANEPLEFTIEAHAVEDATGEQALVIEINEAVDNQLRRLLRSQLTLTPVLPEFGIELKINGQSSDFDIDYGESLNFQAKIVNNSASQMEDVKVVALVDSDVVDRSTVQTNGAIETDRITWTKDHIEKLALLEPGEEVLISWRADLLETTTVGRASVDTVVSVELEGLDEWRQSSQVFIVSVGEGLVFNQGVFWELGGLKLGSGNLPPVTNERSEYYAVWSLDSGNQDYDTVTVSTFLPPKVDFLYDEEVDEGSLDFDEETRRLEWTINNFSNALLPLKATFFIELVPTDEDEGTVMTILNPSTVVASGLDVFQSKSFSVTTANVVASDETLTDEDGDPVDIGTVIE